MKVSDGSIGVKMTTLQKGGKKIPLWLMYGISTYKVNNFITRTIELEEPFQGLHKLSVETCPTTKKSVYYSDTFVDLWYQDREEWTKPLLTSNDYAQYEYLGRDADDEFDMFLCMHVDHLYNHHERIYRGHRTTIASTV